VGKKRGGKTGQGEETKSEERGGRLMCIVENGPGRKTKAIRLKKRKNRSPRGDQAAINGSNKDGVSHRGKASGRSGERVTLRKKTERMQRGLEEKSKEAEDWRETNSTLPGGSRSAKNGDAIISEKDGVLRTNLILEGDESKGSGSDLLPSRRKESGQDESRGVQDDQTDERGKDGEEFKYS